MNVQETIARIFPSGALRDGGADDGVSFEVHGLSATTVPQNCEVLASGQFQFSSSQIRRESYLVKTEDFVLFFRIWSESPDGAFAEFSDGHVWPVQREYRRAGKFR